MFSVSRVCFVFALLVFLFKDSFAQYDIIHHIPPFYARGSSSADLGDHYLFLSTNIPTPFEVTIEEADGTILLQSSLSKATPIRFYLGSKYAATNIISAGMLNTPISNEGLIIHADQPFFSNVRHVSGNQGMSVTAKGTKAYGTRFRCGHLYSTNSGHSNNLKSHMISFMATEDNTTVTVSDIKPGVIFFGTTTTGNTSDPIQVVLDKNESYVIAAHMDEPLATANDTAINGTLITADKPIVVNSGSFLGGSSIGMSTVGNRDIGMDQIVPVDIVGDEYVLVKGSAGMPNDSEKILVIADEDNTEIFINGNTVPYTTLNTGGFVFIPHQFYDIRDIMYVTSSKNVVVYQTTNASPVSSVGVGLNFIPPLNCIGTREVTIPEVEFTGDAVINIIAKKDVTVNFNNVPLGGASPITGTNDWEVYTINNVVGDCNLSSDDIFNVSLSTISGARGAAGYYSGFTDIAPSVKITANSLIEGCSPLTIVLDRGGSNINKEVTYNLDIKGTADNGVDYELIPDSITVAAGVASDTLVLSSYADQVLEGSESIILSVNLINGCGDPIFASDTVTLFDYVAMSGNVEDVQFCPANETAMLEANIAGGASPLSYSWNPSLTGSRVEEVKPLLTTNYSLRVSDICNKELFFDPITVLVECPISAPNVFTPNADGSNDRLVFSDLEFYKSPHLEVFNRWGRKVYDSENYVNDWEGGDLNTGVYYYTLDLRDEDFPDQELEIPVIKGFFHLLR